MQTSPLNECYTLGSECTIFSHQAILCSRGEIHKHAHGEEEVRTRWCSFSVSWRHGFRGADPKPVRLVIPEQKRGDPGFGRDSGAEDPAGHSHHEAEAGCCGGQPGPCGCAAPPGPDGNWGVVQTDYRRVLIGFAVSAALLGAANAVRKWRTR